ncbi:PAS domain S-box protein [Acidovorax lacteus]|uniref:PAS domain S-box protein n=1 Tax=Acidovorax lacteus TaxID=1924988 RepID=A0ABP8LD01_9BURK
MTAAPFPHQETDRLQALHALQLLDTAPEPAFDALTRLAASVLQVPIAAVSLVDLHRQWFKSQLGLDVSETPRDAAFCAHAILGDGPLVISDAQQDPRFADNPLVTGAPHIRAYAGVPLRTSDGMAIGTLCAIDRRPRQFSPEQLQQLRDLAVLATREVQSREQAGRARAVAVHSQQKADAQEQLYQTTFDLAGVGIAHVGMDGRCLRLNPKFCEILGRSANELRSLRFQDLSHPDDVALDQGHLRELMAGHGSSYTLEKRYLRPDGGLVWAQLTVTLVRDGLGVPQYFLSLVQDITQRRSAEDALRSLRHQLEQRVQERTDELRRANTGLAETIRQLQASEQALHESRADLQAVLTHAHDAYICVDLQGLVVEWNRQAERLFGFTRSEAIGRSLDALIIPPAMRGAHQRGMERMARTGVARVLDQRLELPALRRDGSTFACELTITQLSSHQHGHLYAAFLQDITERKRTAAALAQQNEALARLNHEQQLMLDNEVVGIVRTRDRTVLWANRAFERMMGYGSGELVGTDTRLSYADDDTYERVGREAYAALEGGGSYRTEVEMVRKDGERLWVDVGGSRLVPGGGEALWMVLDITARKDYQRRMELLAFRDPLTGLPNRVLLLDRLERALAAAQRHGTRVAVCFADLDGFKSVNDRHGHAAGDEVLTCVARRLMATVRDSDTVARLGGDEFVVLLVHIAQPDDAQPVLQRAQALISAPIVLTDGAIVKVGASFGVAYAPDDSADPAELLAAADRAMYARKRQR